MKKNLQRKRNIDVKELRAATILLEIKCKTFFSVSFALKDAFVLCQAKQRFDWLMMISFFAAHLICVRISYFWASCVSLFWRRQHQQQQQQEEHPLAAVGRD